jgi:tetratricopeptide (TPR) repeat protein
MEPIRKIATLVGLLIGTASQIISLIQAFKNDFTIASTALLAAGFCITVVALITVVWSRVPSVLGDPSESLPRYSKRVRRVAALTLVCLPIALASGFAGWKFYRGTPGGKFIVLVTDFAGPNPKSLRFSEIVVEEIRRTTSSYHDIVIRPIARAITAQEGSTEARKLGQENGAAIVLWGWYGATPDSAVSTVHFEILSSPEMSKLPSSEMKTLPVSELNSFAMQVRIARDYSYVSLIAAGLFRYEQQDYSGAVDRFNAAEESAGEDTSLLDPTYLYFHRGTAYIQLRKQDLAIKDLSRCIANRPDFAAAFINRAVALHDKGQYVAAKADANSALRLEPFQAIGYNTRGVILQRIGDDAAALQDFDKALELDPRLSWAYNNRGFIYNKLGDTERAIQDYNRAIEYGSVLAIKNRAMARYDAADYRQAMSDFSEALKRDPNDSLLYAYRGLTHAALGEVSAATADCEIAARMSPNDAEVYDLKGIVDTQLRDFEGASRDFDTSLRLNPKFPRSYFNRGIMHMRLEQYELALKDFTSAIRLRSDFGDAYLARADTYQKLGKPHLAFQDLASASRYGKRLIITSIEPIDKNGQSSSPSPTK